MHTPVHNNWLLVFLLSFAGATAHAQTPPSDSTTGTELQSIAPPPVESAPPVPPSSGLNNAASSGVADTLEVPPAYDMALRELEERVVGLKERIFNTKTRLLLLREQILHNVIAEARAVLIHRNEMGSAFTLEQVLYYMDRDKIYFQDNRDGALDNNDEFEIWSGNLSPGNHLLNVELVYRGNGTLFSYIDGYLFKIRSNYTFYASKGRVTQIRVVGYERGGMTTDLAQKPYVRYDVQQHQYTRDALEEMGGENSTNPSQAAD